MKDFLIGSIVKSHDNTVILVTGTGKKNVGYKCFAGVVLRCEDEDANWPVGMISNTWTFDAFKSTEIDVSELVSTPKNEFPTEQIEEWKSKAQNWDALGARIEKCYCNSEGEYDEENPEEEGADLITIGEMAATAYGWL